MRTSEVFSRVPASQSCRTKLETEIFMANNTLTFSFLKFKGVGLINKCIDLQWLHQQQFDK
jgi:hypothetical protein